jgi:hypothetical protein
VVQLAAEGGRTRSKRQELCAGARSEAKVRRVVGWWRPTPENMFGIVVTLDTFQVDKTPLKVAAPENMPPVLVTLDTIKLNISLLKALALKNMHPTFESPPVVRVDR